MKISGVNFLSFEQDEEINFHVSIGSMLLSEKLKAKPEHLARQKKKISLLF
jgi:hypothetical protein